MAIILNDLCRKKKKVDIQNLWREGITLNKEGKHTPPEATKIDSRKDGNQSAAYRNEVQQTLPDSRKIDLPKEHMLTTRKIGTLNQGPLNTSIEREDPLGDLKSK